MNKSAAMSAICAITITSSPALAGEILEYVATFGGISGSYDGSSFSDKTITFTMIANTDYISVESDHLYYDFPMLLPGDGPTLVNVNIDDVVNDQINGVDMRLSASDGSLSLGTDQGNGSHAPLFILEEVGHGALTLLTTPGSYQPNDGFLYHEVYWQWYFNDIGGQVGNRDLQIDTWDGSMSWDVLPSSSTGNPIPGIGGIACLAALGVVGRRRR
ncbi:MAG: hypothetical protein CMJ34_05370 [Phycisphaerae bacterium]|nr:hypothetical protein [Phycisphaerae bacterium]